MSFDPAPTRHTLCAVCEKVVEEGLDYDVRDGLKIHNGSDYTANCVAIYDELAAGAEL